MKNLPVPGTTTIMAGDDDMDLMTARAAPGMRKDPHTKKPPAKQAKISSEGKDALYKVSEYSLSEFLDNEPDLYSVADIKVRYK